jgi:hypothetical protein
MRLLTMDQHNGLVDQFGKHLASFVRIDSLDYGHRLQVLVDSGWTGHYWRDSSSLERVIEMLPTEALPDQRPDEGAVFDRAYILH